MKALLDFNVDYVLEDERVLLRPLAVEDIDHLLHFSLNEPEIWTYSQVRAGGGKDQMAQYIQMALDARKADKEYAFVVWDKLKQAYAGSTRFYDIQLNQDTLQLGYTWYGKDFQRTGLNRHCKFLMLQFAFEQQGFKRVEFRADFENKKSITAMKKIGCIEEGVLRNHSYRYDGTRRDSIVLSILEHEWHAGVKENLKALIRQ
ncbi:MAG: GNAT family N-acetyltransferase [Chitinophagaceae bacterium]|nr:GNAT family N-acetyltransferase [Chitinophagaceae bacterium]